MSVSKSETRAKHRPLTLTVFIGIALLIAATLIAIRGFRFWVHWRMDPFTQSQFHRFRKTVVRIPKEWSLEPKPFPADLWKKYYAWRDEWDRFRKGPAYLYLPDPESHNLVTNVCCGSAIDDANRYKLASMSTAALPALKAYEALLAHPNYTAEVFRWKQHPHQMGYAIWVRTVMLAAANSFLDGDTSTAMHLVGLPIAAYRTGDGPLPADWIDFPPAPHIYLLARHLILHCDDKELLHNLKQQLDSSRKTIVLPDPLLVEFYPLVFSSYRMARDGYSLRIPAQGTMSDYLALRDSHQRDYFDSISLKLARDDPRYDDAESIRDLRAKPSPTEPLDRLMVNMAPELTFLTNCSGTRYHLDSVKQAAVYFDLLLEETETRLRELERGETNSVPVVPSATRADVFSGNPYLYHPTKKCFYSTGPDKDDDHLRVRYDRTALPDGDIGSFLDCTPRALGTPRTTSTTELVIPDFAL